MKTCLSCYGKNEDGALVCKWCNQELRALELRKESSFTVVPEKPGDVPSFEAEASVKSFGCALIVLALILSLISGRLLGETFAIYAVWVFVALAVGLTTKVREGLIRDKIEEKEEQWVRQQMARNEEYAARIAEEAKALTQEFESNARKLPEFLKAAENSLRAAEFEFQERAYAPFWNRIESAADDLGSFNDMLRLMESQVRSFNRLLRDRAHDFPPLRFESKKIPRPSRQVEKLREMVRSGQKDFEFATIGEQMATRKVLIAGFRTLEEAISSIGCQIESSSEQLMSALNESSAELQGAIMGGFTDVKEEQTNSRVAFETAMTEWAAQRRRYGL